MSLESVCLQQDDAHISSSQLRRIINQTHLVQTAVWKHSSVSGAQPVDTPPRVEASVQGVYSALLAWRPTSPLITLYSESLRPMCAVSRNTGMETPDLLKLADPTKPVVSETDALLHLARPLGVFSYLLSD